MIEPRAQTSGDPGVPAPGPAVSPAGPTAPATGAEPGYTTTEFWVALVTSLIGLLTAFHVYHFTNDEVQGILGVVTLVAPVVAYVISRGIRKSGS